MLPSRSTANHLIIMGRKRGCPSPQALGPSMRDLLRQCQQEASTNPSISSHNLASHPTTSKVGHNSIPGLVRKRAWRPKKYVPSYFTPSSDQGRSISLCCELPKVNIPLRSRPLHARAHPSRSFASFVCLSIHPAISDGKLAPSSGFWGSTIRISPSVSPPVIRPAGAPADADTDAGEADVGAAADAVSLASTLVADAGRRRLSVSS